MHDDTPATILVAEDDATTRTLLADELTADGYELLVADCCRDALRLMETKFPDLAILDVGLPDGGKGCPFAKKTFTPKAGTVDVKGALRKGVVLEFRVLVPSAIGPVKRVTIGGRRKKPKTEDLCLTPGAASPAACVSWAAASVLRRLVERDPGLGFGE
jgi:hypothetical protein